MKSSPIVNGVVGARVLATVGAIVGADVTIAGVGADDDDTAGADRTMVKLQDPEPISTPVPLGPENTVAVTRYSPFLKFGLLHGKNRPLTSEQRAYGYF